MTPQRKPEEWEELLRGGAVVPDYERYERLTPFPRWIWHCAYWDGPLSGVAMYKEEVVWLECVAESDRSRHRRYLVSRFAPGEWEAEQARQHCFQEYVGAHNVYDRSGQRLTSRVHAMTEWEQYYAKYPADWARDRQAATGGVLGWVEEGGPDD